MLGYKLLSLGLVYYWCPHPPRFSLTTYRKELRMQGQARLHGPASNSCYSSSYITAFCSLQAHLHRWTDFKVLSTKNVKQFVANKYFNFINSYYLLIEHSCFPVSKSFKGHTSKAFLLRCCLSNILCESIKFASGYWYLHVEFSILLLNRHAPNLLIKNKFKCESR